MTDQLTLFYLHHWMYEGDIYHIARGYRVITSLSLALK